MAAPLKDLDALTAKLERAKEHIFNLKEFWDGFVEAGAYPILSQDVPDGSYRLYYLGSVAAIPADVPLITGDAIQNLRSALGDGLGAGVVDQLRDRGFSRGLHEFHGAASAEDSDKYFNRRAEVWGLALDWLHAGAEIPDDPELETDLTAPQYGFSAKQQIQLEKKDDMKARGCASPDMGDVLAMSFAVKVRSRHVPAPQLIYSFPGENNLRWMR